MGFQDRLKNLRQQKNLTQQELAKTIFVSRSAIAKWENGLGVPSDANLKALCDYFEVEENWLLDRNDLKKEIKTVNIQKKNITVSILGIIFPIFFVLLFITPIYHYYQKPNYVYPLVYIPHPPYSIMKFVGEWCVLGFSVWGITFLLSVLDICFFQFKKKAIHYCWINLVMIILSVIIFICVLIISVFSAKQFDYFIPHLNNPY